MQLTNHVLLILGGIGVLYFGAEWLVRGAGRVASALGLSPIVVGLTVVSFGTSAPELAVCLLAALGGNPDIAIGNVMGSNLANIGLILGLTAVIRPLDVAARVVHREVPLMVILTACMFPLLWDLELTRSDGLILILLLIAYLAFVFRTVDLEEQAVVREYEEFARESLEVQHGLSWRDVGLVLLGSAGLVLGGTAIVQGAVFVATELGISQVVIGLTAIAVGTSLPELATSLVAALRGEADIAVGNVIGSNIFNLGAILGVTASVAPFGVSGSIIRHELPAVLLLSIIVWPVTWTAFRIQRWEGALLLGLYLVLGYLLIWPEAATLLMTAG